MFRNRKYYNYLEFSEIQRRFRRHLEGNWNYRKLLLTLFIVAIFILYIAPHLFSWLFGSSVNLKGLFAIRSCDIHTQLSQLYSKNVLCGVGISPCRVTHTQESFCKYLFAIFWFAFHSNLFSSTVTMYG